MALMSACGAAGSTSDKPGDSAQAREEAEAVVDAPVPGNLPANIDLVPAQAKENYTGFETFNSGLALAKSPYSDWTAPKPPWKMCYSTITQQNSWHVEALKMYVGLAKQLEEQGLVSDVVTAVSDGNIGQQINQVNGMVSQGCDSIAVIAPSATALCPAFENAYQHGVLILSVDQTVTCGDVGQVVAPNDYIDGVKTMQWLVGAIEEKGNVLLMQGLPDYPLSDARLKGAEAVLAEHPEIKVLDTLVTEWYAATAKTKLLQWLASHPGTEVNGVWQEGCCGDITSVEGFKQMGRPTPLVNGWGGSAAWLAYWKEKGLNSFDLLQGGPSQAATWFDVTVRMLCGQKPKLNFLIHPVTYFANDEVDTYHKPWMTETSTGFVMPDTGGAVPPEYWDQFFSEGTTPVPDYDPTKYDPSNG
jgi:ribose transport system substrate-binding protein